MKIFLIGIALLFLWFIADQAPLFALIEAINYRNSPSVVWILNAITLALYLLLTCFC